MLTEQQLRQLADHPQPVAQLRDWHALNADTLASIRSAGLDALSADLTTANHLFILTQTIATTLNDDAAATDALYRQAQAATMAGDFARALPLIQTAREQHIAAGRTTAAMTTTLGEMRVLMHQGEQIAAIELATTALSAADSVPDPLIAKLYASRATAHEQLGQYEQALADFAAAEPFQTDFAPHERAIVAINRAALQTKMGAFYPTIAQLTRVVTELAAGEWRSAAQMQLAYAQRMAGQLEDALHTLEQLVESLPSESVDRPIAQIDLAETQLALNLIEEAIYTFDTVLPTLDAMQTEQARALHGRGAAAVAKGADDEGLDWLQQSYQKYAGNAPRQAMVLCEMAAAQLGRGEIELARTSAETALSLLTDHPLERMVAHAHRFDVALASADLTTAARQLTLAHDVAPDPLPRLLRYPLELRRGQLAVAQDVPAAAETHFRIAITLIEQQRGTLQREATRTHFLHDKTAPYRHLIELLLDQARYDEAFAITERARSRTLVELMQQSSPSAATNPDLRDLHAHLNALYNQLLHSDERGARLSRRVVELEQRIQQMQPLDQPMQVTSADWERPTTDDTLISYYTLGSELLAFVSKPDGVTVVRGLTTVEMVRQQQRELVRQWRRLRVVPAKHHAQLERSARQILQRLYAQLFAPLEQHLTDQAAVIVPHGLLHTLPFHAFYDGECYLIDRLTLRYAPSATAFALCQRALPQQKRAAIFGVSASGIEHVKQEVAAIGERLATPFLLDDAATREALQARAPSADILHIACHGLFRNDNPRFSALRLADGWLYAHEIARLNLPPALVTLSACESARAHVLGGDEALGLPRAFLGAGAATVVATLWLADDEATAQLMPDFYRRMEQQAPADALRAAQIALKTIYPHPYHWGSFILMGR